MKQQEQKKRPKEKENNPEPLFVDLSVKLYEEL